MPFQNASDREEFHRFAGREDASGKLAAIDRAGVEIVAAGWLPGDFRLEVLCRRVAMNHAPAIQAAMIPASGVEETG